MVGSNAGLEPHTVEMYAKPSEKESDRENTFSKTMSTEQAPPTTVAVINAEAPKARRSARIKDLPAVFYGKPPKEKIAKKQSKPRKYGVYSIYDRDAGDEEWYWIRWNGYGEEDDTPQHRANLEAEGFGSLCDHVDGFKEWEAAGEDGELRTFADYCKINPVPKKFTADEDGLCFVASLRRAADLLGLVDFLPEAALQQFFRRFPGSEKAGITWQDFTKLIQKCNSLQKKRGKKGITFGGKRSKSNLVRSSFSGRFDISQLRSEPGVYLCGVSSATAGHIFVIHVVNPTLIWVYDSAEEGRFPFDDNDFDWVTRWKFIHQCFVGSF